MKKDLAVYVLARSDLPSLNPGKLAAQSHHAGFQLAAKYASHPLVKEYIKLGKDGGADFFNTTLTISASLSDIEQLINPSTMHGVNCVYDTVVDKSYPFLVDYEAANIIDSTNVPGLHRIKSIGNQILYTRVELTCGYALGDRNDPVFKSLFGRFNLYP